MVAEGTREGEVFIRLLGKIAEQRKAYAGTVFDVLGEAFADRPLRELLVDAIRYGDRPEVQARLQTVIDATGGEGLAELIAERALGRIPTEMPHNHPGYDIRSERPDGAPIRIEVKGRIAGADDFVITRNGVLAAKNLADDYRLALMSVIQPDRTPTSSATSCGRSTAPPPPTSGSLASR
ncbi:DUF3883 domain-containing protein [Pseudonocardia asaccharolytica]|uniref:Protein NO VEIN C-terminal domain-containing protein n=1 Tax=Pseudonocardia asaccharolytica DSM 44247 = NBRC 16224 TaxID=1123024 RepID=A0A511D5C7_9PSEU|nr:DUF3883 domain-containing protein [Pseudonocardia asaccharolytica]GEL18794.1 hypothetical protein PA7_26310 [Pseudonocardia asaccharolytica DSM 44247 = NBRC 16224]